MTPSAPVVNQELAQHLAGEPNPFETLANNQRCAVSMTALITGANGTSILMHGRLVELACGHFTITKGLHKARCRRCGEMIRSGYDYDAYRNRGGNDDFLWPGDPLRALHETFGSAERIGLKLPVTTNDGEQA